jgi:hypothetical protein
MRRLLMLVTILLSLSVLSEAQTTTTITGTVRDLSNALVTSGKVMFTLKPSTDATVSGAARFTPGAPIVCRVQANGTILANDNIAACTIMKNTALTPAGTFYQVDMCPYNACTAKFNMYATATSLDISTVTPTPATSPLYNTVDTFSDQTIAGNKTFTGVSTFSGGIAGNLSLSGNIAFSGTNTHSGTESFVNNTVAKQNGIVFVDGSTYALTTAGIQAAVNAACNGTVLGAVVIPPGTISLGTTGISVPNNCDVSGAGQTATMLQLTVTAATTHFVNASSTPSKIRIHDLTLDGSSGVSLSEGCIGMNQVSSPTDITIERVTCQNVGASAFNITGTAANPGNRIKVLHSRVINAGLGPGAGQLYGILISFDRHVAVMDNEIANGGITTGIVAFSSINASSGSAITDIQIVGNRIHDLTLNGVTGGAIDAGRAVQVVVSNNIMWNLQDGGCVTFESVWGGLISGNACSVADTILTGGPVTIKIPDTTQSGEVATQDVVISGNTIVDNSAVATTNNGITVNGAARNVSIIGNTLSYPSQPTSGVYSIYLQVGTGDANIAAASQNFCSVFSITGNTIVGRSGGGVVLNGIGVQQVAAGCIVDQVTVNNNTVNGVNAGLVVFSASASNGITHLYMHDNTVEGNTSGTVTDGKTYASFFYWNNNPPNGTGIQGNNLPPLVTKFNAGFNADGPGFKHARFGATTATAAAAGAVTTNTFSWTTAFADANYTVTCSGVNPTGTPALSISAVQIAASVTVKTTAITAIASNFAAVDCVAVHD